MKANGMHRTLALCALATSLLALTGSPTSVHAGGPANTRPYWAADAKLQSTEGYGPQVARGKAVYGVWCAACHGAGAGREGRGRPGVEALDALHTGEVPAILDERRDLTPEIVSYFVRNGNTSMMPFYRKTEISDADLADLGAYLSRLNPEQKASESPVAK